MNIRDFIEVEDRAFSPDVEKVIETSTGRDLREKEVLIYKPDKVRPYTGEVPTNKFFNEVKLVFVENEYYDLFCKFFKVNTYVEQNVSKLNLLFDFLKCLDSGKLKYSEEDRSFSWKE